MILCQIKMAVKCTRCSHIEEFVSSTELVAFETNIVDMATDMVVDVMSWAQADESRIGLCPECEEVDDG